MGTTVKNAVTGEESASLARVDQRLEVLVIPELRGHSAYYRSPWETIHCSSTAATK